MDVTRALGPESSIPQLARHFVVKSDMAKPAHFVLSANRLVMHWQYLAWPQTDRCKPAPGATHG